MQKMRKYAKDEKYMQKFKRRKNKSIKIRKGD